jgi:hypothetical protein
LVRYTVDPPTETLLAIASSLTPASAASRICVRIPTMPSGHTELKASTYSDLMPSTVLR